MRTIEATFDDAPFEGVQDVRRALKKLAPGMLALALSAGFGFWSLYPRVAATPGASALRDAARLSTATAALAPAASPYGQLADPGFSASLRPSLTLAEFARPANVAPPLVEVQAPPLDNVPLPPVRDLARLDDTTPVPLPPPRPSEFRTTPSAPLGDDRAARPAATAEKPTTQAGPGGFLENLFGALAPAAATTPTPKAPATAARVSVPASTTVALNSTAATNASVAAYAPAADVRVPAVGRSPSLSAPVGQPFGSGLWSAAASPIRGYDKYTAVYDISARVVYLPDGTRLEAHSGYGDRIDDPQHVNERGKGATPPNIYELTPREAIFHGVRALRMKPVGDGPLFGRAGLLTHSYMLGPNGDSNGCVSFKDYDAFLHAYDSGMVKKLAVVAKLN